MTKEQIAIYLANRSGSTLIREERNRQLSEEGYDWRHDDSHLDQELASAAVIYATPNEERFNPTEQAGVYDVFWPWKDESFKPSKDTSVDGRIKELVKAGALIAAEIDRLQRSKIRAIYGNGAVDDGY